MEPFELDVADVLDTPQAIEARDPGRLLWSAATAGSQVRAASAAADEALAGAGPQDAPRAVLVAADASASIAGEVLACLAGDRVPVVVWTAADLPRWAGPTDALLVASLDGRHPRLAALADQAARRGLAQVTVAPEDSPVASAGARGPVVGVGRDAVRRAALWSLLTPLLVTLARWGTADVPDPVLGAVADALDTTAASCRPTGDVYTNPAKQLAVEFAEALPVLAGAGPLAAIAARWTRDTLALLAGTPAVAVGLPDDVALAGALLSAGPGAAADGAFGEDDFFRDRTQDAPRRPRLLVIGDDGADDDPALLAGGHRGTIELGEVAARRAARALHELAAASGLRSSSADVPDGPPLARFAAATAFGDFTAAYLAIGLGQDPSAPRPGELPH